MTSDFLSHLEYASEVVSTWPKWKQIVLGGPMAKKNASCDQWTRLCDYLRACDFPESAVSSVKKLGVDFADARVPQPKRWAAHLRMCDWDRLSLEIVFHGGVTVAYSPEHKHWKRYLSVTRQIKTTVDGTRSETCSQVSSLLAAQLVKAFCDDTEPFGVSDE